MWASKVSFMSPDDFPFLLSATILAAVVLGGSGNLSGVIFGAFLVAWMPERFRGFAEVPDPGVRRGAGADDDAAARGPAPVQTPKAELAEGTGGMGSLGAEVAGPTTSAGAEVSGP